MSEESETERLTAIAYNKYCEAVGGKAFNGEPLPTWIEFRADNSKSKQSAAWIRAVRSVLNDIGYLNQDDFYSEF